jgi:holliday junction DNA helicase RuvA
MISTLNGIVAEKLSEHLVLDVRGVGYGLYMPLEDYGFLKNGEQTKVYVHEHIRENNYDLFAFTKQDTKKLFEQLLGVTGVGPKMALNILNLSTAEQIRQAIAGGDTKFISQAHGVGKRVAERLVVELKDKVGTGGVDLADSGIFQGESAALKDEAVAALVALGYSVQDASVALDGISMELSTETRVKEALRVKTV